MTSRVRRLGLVTLAVVAALGTASAADAAGVEVSTATSPARARFGDVIQARVTVRARVQRAGAARVLAVRGARLAHRRDRGAGGVVTTVWTFDLQCLEPECAPGKAARHIAVSPSRVLVGSRVVAARFARLVVVPRATTAQVAHPERAFLHPTTLPAPTYRYSPTAVRRLLLAAAVVLVAIAALLAVAARPAAQDACAGPAGGCARARAQLVRAASVRPPPDRRRALGLLARTLRRRGRPQVARAAPTSPGRSPSRCPIAWSSSSTAIEESA